MTTNRNSGTGRSAYRWVVLAVFALINIVVEIHWIMFAPVTGEAAAFYHVSVLQIGMLSMLFMLVYIVMSVPASYVIDTWGLRAGLSIGAALIAVFALLKATYPGNYHVVLMGQIGLAVAQPFILNAITKVGANWFPFEERVMASGLGTLAQYIGIILAMGFTPYIVATKGIAGLMKIAGWLSLGAALLVFLLIRERSPYLEEETVTLERTGVFSGMRSIFRNRDMMLLLLLFFIGLGMFNAVTTWIEQILAPRGFSAEQAGMVGAVMMLGGIIGALILPVLSDKSGKRKPFILIAMFGLLPGLAGLTFAVSYVLVLLSGFIIGFFIMSAGPIGFQYGAELSYPAPESTSQGLMLWVGQVSGVLFIFGMDKFRAASGSMTPFMIIFLVLTVLNILISGRLSESKMALGHVAVTGETKPDIP